MIRPPIPALLLTCLALPCAAQTTTFVFEVDPAQSNWTWAATAGGIPVTPTVSNQFQMFGTFTMELGFNGGGFASQGSMVGGEITIDPEPAGNVSFLGTIRVENTELFPAADPLDFGDPATSNGTFAADFVWHFTQGTATFTPLFGSPSVTDLAGTSTSPALVGGALTLNPDGTLHYSSPQVLQVVVDDPNTGTQFVIDFAGTLTGDEIRYVQPFCSGDGSAAPCPCANVGAPGAGCANGAGGGALLAASGSTSISAADLALGASGLVPSQPGLYFQGLNAVNGGLGNPFGDGLRCAGGALVRIQIRTANAGGASSTTVNVGATAGVSAGDLRRYQIWYRDPATTPCGSGFNLSNGLELTWIP